MSLQNTYCMNISSSQQSTSSPLLCAVCVINVPVRLRPKLYTTNPSRLYTMGFSFWRLPFLKRKKIVLEKDQNKFLIEFFFIYLFGTILL